MRKGSCSQHEKEAMLGIMLCLAMHVFVHPCYSIPYNHPHFLPALFGIWTGAVFLA